MEKSTKKKVMAGIALLLLMLLLLPFINVIGIDFSSHGHGDYKKGYVSSILQSLGIRENYDYTDKFTGESYCFNDDCWARLDEEYWECCTGDDYCPECEEAYDTALLEECPERCEEEVYMWDGSPVTDLGAFAQMAFPDSYASWETYCTIWFMDGTWVSETNKVGCEGAWWLSCSSNSMQSAGEVCETIGKTWTCEGGSAYCSG